MKQNHITPAPGTPGTIQGLLNWDHEVYPTPLEDLCSGIHERVSRHTGFKMLRVSVVKDVLRIEAQGPFNDDGISRHQETLLEIDINTGREIYGRAVHVGFTYVDMDILTKYIKQALSV